MKNQFNLEDYQLINDKEIKCRKFIIVVFLITIGIFFIICKFDFSIYEKQTLIKEEDQFYMIVNSKKINEFKNNKYIQINKNKYHFEISKINNDYTMIDNDIYQTIYIKPYNYKTEAIITECYILKSNKSIYELIIEFIKGGT